MGWLDELKIELMDRSRPMRQHTVLGEMLDQKQWGEAVSLLRKHLKGAEILNPADDGSWALYADQISSQIRTQRGQSEAIKFWEGLLEFFTKKLEPEWGHLHKGHILFRLGCTTLADDVGKGKQYTEEALAEDRIREQTRARGAPIDVDKAVSDYSAYVLLCIIERIEQELFDTMQERQKFFGELLSDAFDAAINRQTVGSIWVQGALQKLVPKEGIEQTLEIRKELDQVSSRLLPISTVSLAGALLESVLLGVLYHRDGVTTVKTGKGTYDILHVELGKLWGEADKRNIFPSDSVRATCKLIHLFRNRLHPGNELRQLYRLSPRVAQTLKILLDLWMIDWSKSVT